MRTPCFVGIDTSNYTTSVALCTESGEVIVLNGYLDIGLADTVKDLFVNFIGAVLFSVIGYFYVKHRGEGHIAGQFIPEFIEEDTDDKEDTSDE